MQAGKQGDAQGIDVSHHNGKIDFKRVAANGISFVFINATQGKSFRSSKFLQFVRDAGGIGQIFELSLHKVRGIHSSVPKNRMTSKSVLLTMSYDMNGRYREIGIVFMKPSIAKQFLWEIEGRLFTTNSRNGVTRL